MASLMKEFEATSNLYGSNAPYVEELYESYLADPGSVDASWRSVFDGWQKDSGKKDVAHSPVIAAFEGLARTVGWIAQWNEMISDPEQKIGRPRQLYVGATQRDVVPLAKRK